MFIFISMFYSILDSSILGDPGAVSRAGLTGVTKVFKHGQKSPWVPTLTGPFPNGQENAGSWLGTKNALYYCAQSGASIHLNVWKWSGESRYPGALLPVLENVRRAFSLGSTDCPWVSEDVAAFAYMGKCFMSSHHRVQSCLFSRHKSSGGTLLH